MQLTSPVSEADYNAYYELRWKILRAPWNQPRGSERDDREADSTHLMVVEGNGAVAGVGRLHFNGISEAQIFKLSEALKAIRDRQVPRYFEIVEGMDERLRQQRVVVLGGVVGPAVWPRVEVDFNEAVDRVYKAAQLARAGRGRTVIVSAGNQPWSASQWAEADLIRDLLVEWGVSKEAVFLEGSSRNTWENAVYSKNIINSIHCGSVLLVTSAAHMPRAVAAFKSAGVDVVPVSTDVRVTAGGGFAAVKLLPDARALAMTSEAIREWIGRKFYQLQGWN